MLYITKNMTSSLQAIGLLAEFSGKNWTKGGLDTYLSMQRETGSTDTAYTRR